MNVRQAEAADIDHLARVWYDGWQDAHAKLLPAELAQPAPWRASERLAEALSDVRVIGPAGAPVGFCMLKGDELYQLYVSAQSRGSGVAAALMADAEQRLAESGVTTAWLACAIGNERAARFYEKCGWRRAGVVVSELEIPSGILPLEVWRYEKLLRRPAPRS